MPRHILLTDTERKTLSTLKNTLRTENYEVHTANSAVAALKALAAQSFDLVVADEQMPGLSGSAMLAKVREAYPQVTRILMLGRPTAEAVLRAVNEGQVYCFLQKPCRGLDLIMTLRRALEHKQLGELAWRMVLLARLQASVLATWEKEQPGSAARRVDGEISTEIEMPSFGELTRHMAKEASRGEVLLGRRIGPRPRRPAGQRPNIAGNNGDMPATKPKDTEAPVVPSNTATADETHGQAETAASPDAAAKGAAAGSQKQAAPPVTDLKSLKPLLVRSDIQTLLDECEEIKAFSPSVVQLLKVTQSDRCSVDNVVRLVKQDHAISLKLLKLANSTAYTRGEAVDSLHKAVMRIGLTQMRQVILNISVIDKFSQQPEHELISPLKFWEHSIATGLIAAELSRALEQNDQANDTAFTMGLLHDVGRMVYLEMLQDRYLEVLNAANQLRVPLEQVESRMLLFNHADAMDRILHKWGFAKELVNAIALHQLSLGNIRRLAPRSLNEVALLALANRLAHALLLGSSGNLTLYPTEDFIEVLKLKPKLIQTIAAEVPGQTNEVKFALLASVGDMNWPVVTTELLKILPQPFHPLHVSSQPEFDATRLFCDVLASPAGDEEKPNVALVRLRSARERDLLSHTLKQAETEAAVGPLPTIILSQGGNIALDEIIMRERSAELLPFPITISVLVEAINRVTAAAPTPQPTASEAGPPQK